METTKYPRTYHLPFSPGTTSDDRKLTQSEFEEFFLNIPVVVTEKLDGENTAITHYDCYARSHGAPTRSPWSRNIWSDGGLFSQIKDKIAEDEIVYGENLYGVHSIEYNSLPSYFHMFAARNSDEWYSWADVKLMAAVLGVPTVPVLYEGVFHDESELRSFIEREMAKPSAYGVAKEGVVIRHANSFPLYGEYGRPVFHKHVCKYVRPHHVQTDAHWTKQWRKAEIKF